eukprot:gene26004-11696_t
MIKMQDLDERAAYSTLVYRVIPSHLDRQIEALKPLLRAFSSHASPLRAPAAFPRLIRSSAAATEAPPPSPSPPPRIGFPYGDTIEVEGREVPSADIAEMLAPFVYEDRIARIEKVVDQRTYNILPVVENIHDMGNLAAVCRKDENSYKQAKRTSAGADKWLDIQMWTNGTTECLRSLKDAGYQIIVTHLSKSSVTIQEVDWTKPTAFLMGSENFGASDEAVALADHCAIIPMTGMVESFNISVAGALVMYEAQQQRLRKLGHNGDLTDEQKQVLKGALMMRSKEGSSVIRNLLDRPKPPQKNLVLKRKRAVESSE